MPNPRKVREGPRSRMSYLFDNKKPTLDYDEAQLTPMIPMPVDIKEHIGKVVHKPTNKNTDFGISMFVERPNCVFFMDRSIRGITTVGEMIFIVHDKKSEISVYESDKLTVSRGIKISDLKSPRGLAGCAYNRTLYISDNELNCIHRVGLINNSITRWKMRQNHMPEGLSVTAERTLLVSIVIIQDKDNLSFAGCSGVVEYTSDGQLLCEIRFDESIQWVWQALQMSTNDYLVCHGKDSSLHRVCVINTEGQITNSYGLEKGRGEGQLDCPCSVTVDNNDKRIFVADYFNDRVHCFDADLRHRGQYHTPRNFTFPSHVYYDSSTEQLFVAGKHAWLSSSTKFDIMQVNTKQITGVTVVDDEIFVVGERQSQINVYDSLSLTASRDINIPDMTSPTFLAGCSYNKTLYIGDVELSCIHRVDLTNNSVTRLKINKDRRLWNLSMTNEHKLLVTVEVSYYDEEKYFNLEYTSGGQLVREMRLDSERGKAALCYFAPIIKLSSDQFVVCHKWGPPPYATVSLINTEGQIIKSYAGRRGGGEGQLDSPSSMAIDYNSKHVFVADQRKNRILMLDTDLAYLGHVHTPPDLWEPDYLYFDSSTDRLIVVELTGHRVLVISHSH